MKNWKVPTVILGLLIVALIFRWGDLGSSTNNGTTIKTKVDHWNGSVWQTTIKDGSYSEKIVNPSWFESMRMPIEKQVEYKEPVYTPKSSQTPNSDNSQQSNKNNPFLYFGLTPPQDITYVTKTKTIQVPPPPIYWLSSDGLIKIWFYITLVTGIWLIITVVITGKKRNKTIEM